MRCRESQSDEAELRVNGMSFSQRQSRWANSALVAAVSPTDLGDLGAATGDGVAGTAAPA